MFEKWYALDPGSYQMHLYDYSQENRMTLRTCVAYQNKEVLALSKYALEYVYSNGSDIQIKYPINEGKIMSDVSPLIKYMSKEMKIKTRIKRPCLLIILPQRDEEIENQWVMSLSKTEFKKFEFVTMEQLLDHTDFHFYIHSGNSYTKIGLIVNGEEKLSKTIHFAGEQIDEGVKKIVAQKTNHLISNEDARVLKELTSNNLWKNQNKKLSCFAMDRYQRYEKVFVSCMDIWPALESVEKQIVMWTKQCISTLNINLQERIIEKGITLTGGTAACFGLKQYLEYELHCPVYISENTEYDMIEMMKGWK